MARNDMRISVDFVDHPKTKRLVRQVGFEGVYCLLKLFSTASKIYQRGMLKDCDQDDIEDMCGWTGESGKLFAALIDEKIGFLEDVDGQYHIHDWEENQPWIYHAGERSRIAKENIKKRWNKDLSETPDTEKEQDGYQSDTNGNTDGIETVIPNGYKVLTQNTPTPIPIPIPKERESLNLTEKDARGKSRNPSPFSFGETEEDPKPILFGKYKNVSITQKAYASLLKRFGGEITQTYIEKLSAYMKSSGRKYADHVVTMTSWLDEDLRTGKISLPQKETVKPLYCDLCGKPLTGDQRDICEPCNRRTFLSQGAYVFETVTAPEKIQDALEALRSIAQKGTGR